MNTDAPAQADTAAAAELALARRVIETEADAVRGVAQRLDNRFTDAVALLHDCRGRVIVSGMGKSGLIGRKMAATLSSTGTPSYFLHPAEAIHGDLGLITADDVVVGLSQSGETAELVRVLEFIRRIGARLIAITGNATSTLAQAADVTLDCHVDEEACPLNLAPTASTTAALALGDALAMTLLVRRGFRPEDFASLHPGGRLGKRLLHVERLMHAGASMPSVACRASLRDVLDEMSSKGLGMTCVVADDGKLAGVITDGDLRRHLGSGASVLDTQASALMTTRPVTVGPRMLAVEALKILEERKISSLIVCDDGRRPVGVVHLHDLWRTEMF